MDYHSNLLEILWEKSRNININSEFVYIPTILGHITDIFQKNYNKYILELGSGWGEVAIELGKTSPDTGFILMEKKVNRIKFTIRMIRECKLENIRIIPLNFQWFLTELFHKEQFDKIILNFPDPWPKNKHFKHRTVDAAFPDKLNYLLKPGGLFCFATDHSPYALSVLEIFRNDSRFYFPKNEYDFSREFFPISKFEKENILQGKKIFYLERIKKDL